MRPGAGSDARLDRDSAGRPPETSLITDGHTTMARPSRERGGWPLRDLHSSSRIRRPRAGSFFDSAAYSGAARCHTHTAGHVFSRCTMGERSARYDTDVEAVCSATPQGAEAVRSNG